ncbi:hypothetical protein LCGC14_0974520 [marine sediment metagenome]|uniref:Uncharacterized protein n=1 Tax=marine sediment metagenome TaxID=412755 RepID=A0A0F9NWT3_9ZZZZ
MPLEIPNHIEFTVHKADQVLFNTRTNGDTLVANHMILDQDEATTLTWLVNSPNKLKIEITELTEPLDPED